MCSSSADKENVNQILSFGGSEYISKPINIAEAVQRIEQFLKKVELEQDY